MAAVYSGTLTLDKVTGLRADKVTKQLVPLKQNNSKLQNSSKSMKTRSNTKNGAKY